MISALICFTLFVLRRKGDSRLQLLMSISDILVSFPPSVSSYTILIFLMQFGSDSLLMISSLLFDVELFEAALTIAWLFYRFRSTSLFLSFLNFLLISLFLFRLRSELLLTSFILIDWKSEASRCVFYSSLEPAGRILILLARSF